MPPPPPAGLVITRVRTVGFPLRTGKSTDASLGRYLVMQFTYRTDGVGVKPHMLLMQAAGRRTRQRRTER